MTARHWPAACPNPRRCPQRCSCGAAQELRLQAAGRTDSGVHARGQVVSFFLPARVGMSPAQLRAGLNACLPGAIRVQEVARVPPDFSARHRCRQLLCIWSRATSDATRLLLCLH